MSEKEALAKKLREDSNKTRKGGMQGEIK